MFVPRASEIEQNSMVQTTRNFELFDKKKKQNKTKTKTKTKNGALSVLLPFLTKR